MALTSETSHSRKQLPTSAPCLPHPSMRPYSRWIIRSPSKSECQTSAARQLETGGHLVPRFGQMRDLGTEEGLEDRVASEQLFATVSGEIFRVYPHLPGSVLLEY